tara:strand:+ start:953 stop:1909 length:957 start_codon:yes stop_codon:yes gene_type:complete
VGFSAGAISLGIEVGENQGTVSRSATGGTELSVSKGSTASLQGSGLRAGSTVQVFLPLSGGRSEQLAQIPVSADGTFAGDASFAQQPTDVPLPVGKNVLQLVSVDENGDQVVLEMTVNISQGQPAPEFNRRDGVIPTMGPGQSGATSGGEPIDIVITPVSEQNLAVIEGDGWSMEVNVLSDQGGVGAGDGGALLTLVRNEPLAVSGDGFMPGTRADVWLFSEPTLLGTVVIDEDGQFVGEFTVDPRMIPVGEHTLQLQGVGDDGYVRAANMGVVVEDSASSTSDDVSGGLGMLWWVFLAIIAIVLALVVMVLVRRRGR